MSEDRKDGGPAFPFEYDGGSDPFSDKRTHTGMSLRDYYAGQAIGPLAALWGGRIGDVDNAALNRTALLAYAFADAMLVVRKQR